MSAAEENARLVAERAAEVRSGGVAEAARDDPEGRFGAGDALGYVGEDLCAWGEPAETLAGTLARLAGDAELVTCIAGAEPPLGRAAVASVMPAAVELDYQEGGQPAWWWLLSAE